MIAGIGVDIARVSRVAAALARRPRRLPRRILTAEERAEFVRRGSSPKYLAARFAAKEALAKALGTGFRGAMRLGAAGVLNDAAGRPQFRLDAALSALLESRGVGACHVSLSDDGDYAAAMVVAESKPPPPPP